MQSENSHIMAEVEMWYRDKAIDKLLNLMTASQLLLYRKWAIRLTLRYLERRRKRLPLWMRLVFLPVWIAEDNFIHRVRSWINNPTLENAQMVESVLNSSRFMTTGHSYIYMAMSAEPDQIAGLINRAVGFSTLDQSFRFATDDFPAAIMGGLTHQAQLRAVYIILLCKT